MAEKKGTWGEEVLLECPGAIEERPVALDEPVLRFFLGGVFPA
jgi:hypothetical protein